jgi:HTH-type transcriptional regulator/antitoxin HipB
VYVTNARDVGHVIRDRRQELELSQTQLADAAGVSRRWLLALESGKATAQVELVFRTLAALGLVLEIQPESTSGGVDLDDLLSSGERPPGG